MKEVSDNKKNMGKKQIIAELNNILRQDKTMEDNTPPIIRLSELRYHIYELIKVIKDA